MEALEVAAVGGGVVAGRRPTHDGEVRLVHELGRGDAAADRAGVIDQPRGLLRRPDAGGVARSGAGGERGDDLRVHRPREIDDALPLRARKHALEAGRRRRGRRLARGKICRVRPRSADADIGRPERGGELAQARIAQVDRRPVLVQVRVHAGGRVCARRPGVRRELLENAVRLGAVRLPEPPAGDLDHLHVIRLVALRDGANARHCRRRQGDGLSDTWARTKQRSREDRKRSARGQADNSSQLHHWLRDAPSLTALARKAAPVREAPFSPPCPLIAEAHDMATTRSARRLFPLGEQGSDIVPLLNDLIRESKHVGRNDETQSLRSFQVEDELEGSDLGDRQVGWFFTIQNLGDIASGQLPGV